MEQRKKTTIRLTADDINLIENLGRVLGKKLGKFDELSQSDVIRYSLRRVAELELRSSTDSSDRRDESKGYFNHD